jgi:dolichol-phosphate mannosyltransferase|tara:strand:+ start:1881 stop:2612 length:732 start_codon:yes stop_codon:yes gene_type:complete
VIKIVLPAYNEEETILPLIMDIKRILGERFNDFEVIVVNDGSTDNTAKIVSELNLHILKLVEHNRNKGLSESIKTGLLYALKNFDENDIIVTMDADNTHSPGLIHRMSTFIEEGNDVVIASRYRPGARVIGLTLARKTISFGGNMLLRLLFPTRGVKDYTSGYRAYRAGVLSKAFDLWENSFINEPGFSCQVDILLKLRKMRVIMNEVPLILRYDQKESASKMNVTSTIIDTLKLVVKRLVGI